MTYTPLTIKGNPSRRNIVSQMGRKGLNLEGLPEMMNLEYAKSIVNYIPHSFGVAMRRGIERVAEKTGLTTGPTLFKYFTNGNFIMGYSTIIERYDITTDTFTAIKSNFTANSGWGGDRYGEYFFVTNGVDKPWRISNTYTITEVTNAPICDDMVFIENRAVAISLSSDETAVQISEVDDASNPPFDSWTTTTAADSGAIVNYRNIGRARSCVALGKNYVVFSDDGYFAFSIEQLDSSGTIKKIEMMQDYITDFGGARGAVSTPKGVFYFNEGGFYRLYAIGQVNQPESRQQKLITVLLTDQFFEDADMSSPDIVYDESQKCVFITYAQDSTANNKVLGYKISEEVEAVFEIDGWNISRFTKYNNKIYGSSSVDGRILECFKGWDDDGLPISTEYVQELPLGSVSSNHMVKKFYSKGFLSEDSEININFDIYDKEAKFLAAAASDVWTPTGNSNVSDGWGSSSWGASAWGGDYDLSTMIEDTNGFQPRIYNAQRVIVSITSSSLDPHIINWFSAEIEDKGPLRIRHAQV